MKIGVGAPGAPTGGLHVVAAAGVTVAGAVAAAGEPSLASLAACCSVNCGATAAGWATATTGAAAAAFGLRLPSLASRAACCSVSCVAAAGVVASVGATGAAGAGSETAGMAVAGILGAGGGGGTALGATKAGGGGGAGAGGGGGGVAATLGVDTPGLRLLSLASRAACSSVSSVVIAFPSAVSEPRVFTSSGDGWASGRSSRGRSGRSRSRRIGRRWLWCLRRVRWLRFCHLLRRCRSRQWRGGGCSYQWRNRRFRLGAWGCVGRGRLAGGRRWCGC